MKLSHIIAIISISSVLLFFIITYAFPGAPAWLVFIAAGLAMLVAKALKDKNEKTAESNGKVDEQQVQLANQVSVEAQPEQVRANQIDELHEE